MFLFLSFPKSYCKEGKCVCGPNWELRSGKCEWKNYIIGLFFVFCFFYFYYLLFFFFPPQLFLSFCILILFLNREEQGQERQGRRDCPRYSMGIDLDRCRSRMVHGVEE